MECLEAQNFSKGYKIFWSIYWVFAFFFLTVNHAAVLGDEEGRAVGVPLFFALLALLVFCIFWTIFYLRPRRVWDERGREVKGKVKPYHLLAFLAIDIWCFVIMELVNNENFAEMTWKFRFVNVLGIFIVNMIALFWMNSWRRAMITTLSIWTCFAIFFYLVYTFRGEPLQVIDFFSFGTGMNAAKNYHFTPTRWITADIIVAMSVMSILLHTQDRCIAKRRRGKIAIRLGVFAFMVGMFFFYTRSSWNADLDIMTDLFSPIKTYRKYGTTVGFFSVAKYMRLTAPDGYSIAEVNRIIDEANKEIDTTRGSEVKPVNIIAIMNESWCDYRLLGDLQTNDEVMPFYDSLSENTIKGSTLVCIRGGGTAKSEYEFLTGNSVKRFPGMVPYVSYFTHDQYSIVTTLEAQGYRAEVMHPYIATNWNRPAAYELLSFDKFYSVDDFDDSYERLRGFVSDKANYQKIIELVEAKEKGEPYFIFDITMQNHGGYKNNTYPQKIRTTNGYNSEEVNRFLSLLRATDDALEYLISYFEKAEEPTLILVFGDHYPTLPDEFTEKLSGAAYEDLPVAEQVKYFSTPFLIWANYDIPEQEDVITSCNFLSTLLLDQTGLEMTEYNYYLKDLMKEIPALNHLGYYDANKTFRAWKEASTRPEELEREYECLQYNELGENRKRVTSFFSLED